MGRIKRRWRDNTKIDTKRITRSSVDWIYLTRIRNQFLYGEHYK